MINFSKLPCLKPLTRMLDAASQGEFIRLYASGKQRARPMRERLPALA